MDTALDLLRPVALIALRPAAWLGLGLALTVLAALLRRRALAQRAGLATLGLLAVLGVVPLGDMLLSRLEAQHPAQPDLPVIDGIVVLGGAEDLAGTAWRGQVQLHAAAERYLEAAALARRHPQARLVFTGGGRGLRAGPGRTLTEADVAARVFADLGIDRAAYERGARNTLQNAHASLALAAPQPGEVWVLVTSAAHMPRALHSFAAAGWPDIRPWPVDFRSRPWRSGFGWGLSGNLERLEIALREHAGLAAYGIWPSALRRQTP